MIGKFLKPVLISFFMLFMIDDGGVTAGVNSTYSFSSSNLPIILIDTRGYPIQDAVRIRAWMEVKYHDDGSRNDLVQENNFAGRINIEIRGSSSAYFDKKSFGFETQDANGDNLNVPLIDFPAENDWILYGPYSDKSLLRNAITFYLARKMGRYASRMRFCELFINGEYLGLYILMEKIKRDKNRVNISKLTPETVDGDDLTGGYIIKVDKKEGQYRGWTSYSHPTTYGATPIFFQYVYPQDEIITPAQESYIQKYILDFETALNGRDFRENSTGYLPFVDHLSFVDMFIINELTKDIDGYRYSMFMYKEKNGPLTMGPIWDYNLGYGNVNYGSEKAMEPEGWMYDQSGQRMYWWVRMMENYKFKKLLCERYYDLRRGAMSNTAIHATVDSLLNHIDEAQQRNFIRWPILGIYVWPNYFVGADYQAEIEFFKNWIDRRLSWMDNNMPYPDRTNIQAEEEVSLMFGSPNPFTTSMSFSVSALENGQMSIRIHDLLGRHVKTINQAIAAGQSAIINWDGTDQSGIPLSPGVYFYSAVLNNNLLASGKIVKR